MNDNIRLLITPGTPPMEWEEFVTVTSPFSIALDGMVIGEPQEDPMGPRANFNHHEGVNRLCTRATCGQVLIAIRQGLFNCFRNAYGPKADVYVNDCDEDVCLSWYLLKNHYRAEIVFNPLLNRLVNMEDALDATAGAYPYPKDLPVLGELAWIFEHYRNFRIGGGVERKVAAEFGMVIESTCSRIDKHLMGDGDSIPLDTSYETIGGHGVWRMVRETGAQARTGMLHNGIKAFVSVRPRPDGRYTYTVGRMSGWIPFDVPRILERLNQREMAQPDADPEDRWGGGNTIGGSPRVRGSALRPHQVEEIIDEEVSHGGLAA